MLDLLIRGGTLYDGSGQAPRVVDVGVAEGRVREVGALDLPARETIEAAGKWVLPGFVDVHTHYDLCLEWPGLSAHCLRQGITTVIGGNCGLGDPDTAAALESAERARLGVHFAVLAPLGPLRSSVIPRGEGRPARPGEYPALQAAVARALDAGAVGVSWGPYHANALMDPAELGAALSVAAARGKPWCVHRRKEGVGSLAATEEALTLARDAGVGLQISHLKAAGRLSWGGFEPVLECIDAARRDQEVAVDVYPYDASLTYLSAVIPEALKADGGLAERLRTAEGRAAARAGVEGWFSERMGPEWIVVLEPALSEVPRGSTLAEAAERLGSDPVEAALRLIAAERETTGGWAIYREMMDPAQVEAALDLPYAAVASDAVPEEDGQAISAHPRAFATFARALRRAAAGGEARLAEAVRKATAFPAQRFGLVRGRVEAGAVADLLVVSPELDEGATYREPTAYPRGIELVLVAGEVALREGQPTEARAGVVLRR